jgi:hypothetical protein
VAGGDDLAGGKQAKGEEPGVLVVLPMRDGASAERIQQAVSVLAGQMGLGDTWTKTPGATMLQGTMSGELVNQPERKLPVAIGLVSASNAAQVKYVWIGLGTAASQKAQEWVK